MLWRFAVGAFAIAVMIFASCRGDQVRTGQIQQGQQVYFANCATCHGAQGEGQPDWKVQKLDGTYPAPPHDSSGHTWHHGDGLLFRYGKYGGAALEIPAFESGMPAFEGKLSDEEIKAVILYLKTLWGQNEREFQAEVSKQDPFPENAP
jgi:mono/diheme cytochrome c family protein